MPLAARYEPIDHPAASLVLPTCVVQALEMRLQMMEQKLAASEQVQRYNENVRSQVREAAIRWECAVAGGTLRVCSRK